MSADNGLDDGGPAFPQQPIPAGDLVIFQGMSLRDWFAGQAISAYMSWSLNEPPEPGDTRKTAAKRYATVAYEIADAMLSARSKKEGE